MQKSEETKLCCTQIKMKNKKGGKEVILENMDIAILT